MQHLVAPGENWETLAAKVQPGDEIILMPGRHKPATIERLKGKKGEPITIRGLDPDNVPEIAASRHGILILDPQHIVIENVHVTGASIAGIALRSLPDASASPGEAHADVHELNVADVRLRNVKVTKVGPQGRRDSIELVGQQRVFIENCTLEGWGGAGIAIIACEDIEVTGCTFRALPDHTQTEGILMRSGAGAIKIENCTFEKLDGPAIFAGGRSDPAAFQPVIAADAKPGSIFEARHIQVTRCVFKESRMPIMMQSADDVLVRNCTFVRPKASVIMVDHKHEDPRFAPAARFVFGDNIITWQPGDLVMYAAVVPSVDLRDLTWEQNIWWSPEPVEVRQKLGEFQGNTALEQLLDLDPKLDEKLRPQEPAAEFFGAFTP